MKALPFKCKSLQGAAQANVTVVKPAGQKGGCYEVMFPVAFPDEGTFDWVDHFLEQNKQFVELSDRKLLEWAEKSGMQRPKSGGSMKSSLDKPEFNFGIPNMDDLSVRRVFNAVAPVIPRNYLVMEVKGNLVPNDRRAALKRFSAPCYKKVAHVVMGEPNEEYKGRALELLLKEKQEKAEAEWKAKKDEKERQKKVKAKQRELEEMRKKAEETRKKAVEEARRKADEKRKELEAKKKAEEEAKKKAEAAAAKEAGEGGEKKAEEEAAAGAADAEMKEEEEKAPPAEEVKEEAKEEEKKDEDVEMKEEAKEEPAEEEEEEDVEPPQVELTEEEKKMWFRTKPVSDLTPSVLNLAFGNFAIPDESEGFDDIRFEWQDAEKSTEYLRSWVLERKRTSRIEDLQPSQWFKEKLAGWHKSFEDWQQKQKAHKEVNKDKNDKKEEEKDEEQDKEAPAPLDIFSVEDVCDMGNGEPLFGSFNFEDWAMLQLRFELYLLVQAFKHDVDDPDRPGIPDGHLSFYYGKYFMKQFTPKHFGVTNNQEVCELIKDTVSIDSTTKLLTTTCSEDMDTVDLFVKLTEENRRERQRRIDAGDETAKLKFSPLAMQKAQAAAYQKPGAVGAKAGGGTWPQVGGGAPYRPAGPGGGGWRPQGFAAKPAWPGAQKWR